MPADVKGFPQKWPVRDGDAKPWRYRVTSALARAFLRVVTRGRIRFVDIENIPPEGPLLVVSNHVSNLDPMMFGGFFPRTLFAMAKREMYGIPVIAWWLAGCNCFPVDRGTPDRRALMRALDILRNRGRLLIFIEGTRSRTASMQKAEAGAGFLARKSGAPVLPVAVWGTEGMRRGRLFRRVEITMRVGVPFDIDAGGRRDDAVADDLAAAVAELLPPRYRGVYAGTAPVTVW